jgi:DNA polymerase-3 subunit epsilon
MEIPDGEPEPPRLKHVPNLNTQRVIVIDIEKTGYRIMGFPESIEIGAVELIHGQPTRTFHSWIKNETPISIYAENLHGISADFLKDQRSLREVMRDFNKFVGEDSLLVFHSAENDADTLEHDMPLAGLPAFERSRISCTAKMAKGLSLQSKKGHMLSLNALCDILNINHSLRDARGHSALLDANLTAECLIKMSHNANYQTLKSFGFEKTSLTSRRVKEQLAEIYKMTCEIDYENDNVVFQSSVAKIEVPSPPYPDTHYPQVMGRTFVIKNAQGEIDNPLGPAMYFTNQANILSGFYDQGVRGKILDIKDLEMQNTTIVKY